MRKLLLSLLLATTAVTPAFAQRADREDRAEEREQRRAERAEARKVRAEAREAARPERVQRTERVERNVDAGQRNVTVRDERRAANVNERGRPTLDQRRQARDEAAAVRQQQRDDLRERIAERRDQRRVTPPPGARPDRPAPPPPTVTSNTKAPTWHTTWRRDHRYDWRNWRERNRSLFRLGFYFDPFGWGYRRYGIGWRLWPSYYSMSYWLNDPFMYRLPYAPWPYRWVRYYDDALLVNTMTGQVVDVMYDFFW